MNRLKACRDAVVCPDCDGKRLNPIALAVDFRGHGITQLCEMTISNAHHFFETLSLVGDTEENVGTPIIRELRTRLEFLKGSADKVAAAVEAAPTSAGLELAPKHGCSYSWSMVHSP